MIYGFSMKSKSPKPKRCVSSCICVLGFCAMTLVRWTNAAAAQEAVSKNGGGSNVVATIPAGKSPRAVVVDPVTNKIYVGNRESSDVTVIDGAANTAINVKVGSNPVAIAVNSVTNKVYVASKGSNAVWVIDGATNATTKVGTGKSPGAAAVNPVTNKIYVTNEGDKNVTVIDGATNQTAVIGVGINPVDVAVNPATNKIYVVNLNDVKNGTVTVIDGASNTTTTIDAGMAPGAVAVNSLTNKIYVANCCSVIVIDGATNATTSVASGAWLSRMVGANPLNATGLTETVAVNSATNKIYVSNSTTGLSVIDGATNSVMSVEVGKAPWHLAVNPSTNTIYVTYSGAAAIYSPPAAYRTTLSAEDPALHSSQAAAYPTSHETGLDVVDAGFNFQNYGVGSLTSIDGASSQTANTPFATGMEPAGVAVNPVTNRIYVTNEHAGSVTIIDGNSIDAALKRSADVQNFVAVNPVTNHIYLANFSKSTMVSVDGVTNKSALIAKGFKPHAMAVNSQTNKIYVPSSGESSVTIFDGATNTGVKLPTGNSGAVAIDEVVNKIYIANCCRVSVIDGTTNATKWVQVVTRSFPPEKGFEWVPSGECEGVAVNPVTNKIFVINANGGTVAVLDGTTSKATTLSSGINPCAIAVNSVTGKIYVANRGSNNVTVIDGATSKTAQVAVGNRPIALAVNSITNKMYVLNSVGTVTVLDGTTNKSATVAVGRGPRALSVNPVANKIYVVNTESNNLTVIDGLTNQTKTVATGNSPWSVAVNSVTNKIYVATKDGMTVIDGTAN